MRAEKIYRDDDSRLKSGTKGDVGGKPERKRFWEGLEVWTGGDFGAGPGSVAVREVGKGIVVLGVGGGMSYLLIR